LNEFDSIFILITHIEKPYKKKDLYYLVDYHPDAILFKHLFIKEKNEALEDFKPWLIVKNNGEGIFILKKILEKFSPWVIVKLQKTIYEHDIPDEFKDLKKWVGKEVKKLTNIHIKI